MARPDFWGKRAFVLSFSKILVLSRSPRTCCSFANPGAAKQSQLTRASPHSHASILSSSSFYCTQGRTIYRPGAAPSSPSCPFSLFLLSLFCLFSFSLHHSVLSMLIYILASIQQLLQRASLHTFASLAFLLLQHTTAANSPHLPWLPRATTGGGQRITVGKPVSTSPLRTQFRTSPCKYVTKELSTHTFTQYILLTTPKAM